MSMRFVLRAVAVLIAVLGTIDPAITLERPVRSSIVVTVDDSHPSAIASAQRLSDLLRSDHDVRLRPLTVRLKADPTGLGAWGPGGLKSLPSPQGFKPPSPQVPNDPTSLEGRTLRSPSWGSPSGGPFAPPVSVWGERASGCAAGDKCVLIGGDEWAANTRGEVVGVLRVERPGESRVTIDRVNVPTATHASAVGQLQVALEGRGVNGQSSTIDVLDQGVPVGHAEHTWTADGIVDVPIQWWPLGDGLRRLSVRVARAGATGVQDDEVDVGVDVGGEPYNVLVYDTRPSWTSTFIRRALEQDARVALRVAARLGPRLEVTAGTPFRLEDATLGDASAVVIGAPDGLSAQEVDALDRFVRVRGGSLVLAPDARPTGPIAGLLLARLVERLEPSPVAVGEWRASELLVAHDVRAGASVLAKAGDDAVVIATPSGNGRVIAFGAMDAWRYRDSDNGAFDRAWQSLVADAAAAGGRPIDVTVDRAVVRPLQDVSVDVRLRAMAASDATTTVSATVACDDQPRRMVRLWPTGDRRRFEGRFSPEREGACRITVSSTAPAAATAAANVLVAGNVRGYAHSQMGSHTGSDPDGGLRRVARIAGVPVRAAGDETTLAGDVRQRVSVERAPSPVQPMRSPWWIVPFAGCLGLEWWLRRRHGLR